jgi:hypothetical protein
LIGLEYVFLHTNNYITSGFHWNAMAFDIMIVWINKKKIPNFSNIYNFYVSKLNDKHTYI